MIKFILAALYIGFNFVRAMQKAIDGERDVVVGMNLLFGFFIFLYEKIRYAIDK